MTGGTRPWRCRALRGLSALEHAPAEVLARRAVLGRRSRSPRGVLADVADGDGAVGAVEREAPRVAQPVGVDLGARRRTGRRRGCRRGPCRPPPRRAGRCARAWRTASPGSGRSDGGRPRAAVADADVEQPVGPELQLAAVVVGSGWGRKHPPLRSGVDPVRVGPARWNSSTRTVPSAGGVVGIDQARLARSRGRTRSRAARARLRWSVATRRNVPAACRRGARRRSRPAGRRTGGAGRRAARRGTSAGRSARSSAGADRRSPPAGSSSASAPWSGRPSWSSPSWLRRARSRRSRPGRARGPGPRDSAPPQG